MKYAFILMAWWGIAGSPSVLRAQYEWPAGTQWSFTDWGMTILYNVEGTLSLIGDTMILGVNAQHFRSVAVGTPVQSSGTDTLESDLFTHSSGGIVHYLNQNEWDTLYWFDALPGDSWQLPFYSTSPFMPCPPEYSTLHVIDTGQVVIGGVALRRLVVRQFLDPAYMMGNTYQWDTEIIERISLPDPFELGQHCGGGTILCGAWMYYSYYDPQTGLQPLPLLSTNIQPSVERERILVRQGEEHIDIDLPGERMHAALRLMDSRGALLREQRSTGHTTTIPIGNLVPGVYIIEARYATGEADRIRWMKP